MTKKGKIRSAIALGSIVITGAAIGLGIHYGTEEKARTSNDLRWVTEGLQPYVPYENEPGSKSGGYISDRADSFASQALPLLRYSMEGSPVSYVNGKTPDGEHFTFHEGRNKKFIKLVAASSVIVTPLSGANIIYNNWKHENSDGTSSDPKSVNHPNFKTSLLTAKDIQFSIAKDVHYVNNYGEKTPYTVKPLDYYYSIVKTILSNNDKRLGKENADHKSYSIDDVLFGYDFDSSWTNKQKFDKAHEIAENLRTNIGAGEDINGAGKGYTSNYLWDLYGLQDPIITLAGSNNKIWFPDDKKQFDVSEDISGNTDYIGYENGEQTVKFSAQNQTTGTDFYSFMSGLLINSRSVLATPSEYIYDNRDKKPYNGHQQFPGLIKEFGVYSYGFDFKNLLYAGAFYIQEWNKYEHKTVKNPEFIDQEWVKSKHTINSLTWDFVQKSDKTIFAQSMAKQFENNRVYRLSVSAQPNNVLEKFNSEYEKYGRRYFTTRSSTSTPNDLQMNLMVSPNTKLDDGFLRAWYGSSLADIKSGVNTFADSMSPAAVVFRTALTAAVNPYTFHKHTNGGTTAPLPWESYMAPEALIGGTGPGNDKQAKDFPDDFEVAQAFKLDGVGGIVPITKPTILEEIIAYQNSKTIDESAKSSKIDEYIDAIVDAIRQMETDKLLDPGMPIKIEFPYRWINQLPGYEESTNDIKNVVAALDSKVLNHKITFESIDSTPATINANIAGWTNVYKYSGWGIDYDGIGSWVTGLNMKVIAGFANLDPTSQTKFTETKEYVDFISAGFKAAAASSEFGITDKTIFNWDLMEALKNLHFNDYTLLFNSGFSYTMFGKSSDPATIELQNKLKNAITSIKAKLDKQYQSAHSAESLIKLILELTSIQGVSLNYGMSLPSREVPLGMFFNRKLMFNTLDTGLQNIIDWRAEIDPIAVTIGESTKAWEDLYGKDSIAPILE